jgi:hypothetical protein
MTMARRRRYTLQLCDPWRSTRRSDRWSRRAGRVADVNPVCELEERITGMEHKSASTRLRQCVLAMEVDGPVLDGVA